MNFSVTKNGKPLNEVLYDWNENTKTFSSNEHYLVLDFREIDGVTFKTGYDCIFYTGTNCIFYTGTNCTFDTGSFCTFDTGYSCTFKTGSICIFRTGDNCTFDTGGGCTFDTEDACTFDTRSNCTFDTSYECIFDTGYDCTFRTGYDCTFRTGKNCVVVRRDIFEVIVLEENQKIKLNAYKKSGFVYEKDTKTIIVDGKECEISLESFKNIQKEINN